MIEHRLYAGVGAAAQRLVAGAVDEEQVAFEALLLLKRKPNIGPNCQNGGQYLLLKLLKLC